MVVSNTIVWYAFGFALAGRLLDLLSTFLVTPTLKLEGNWLVRRFGWKFALASILLALFAFASPLLGVDIGTLSCVMALSNMQFARFVRLAGGEDEFAKIFFTSKAAASFSLRRSLLDMVTITLPVFCIGAVLLFATGANDDSIVAGVAYGFLTWGAAIIALRTASLVRIYRRRRAARSCNSDRTLNSQHADECPSCDNGHVQTLRGLTHRIDPACASEAHLADDAHMNN